MRAHWSTFVLRTPVFALGAARRAHAASSPLQVGGLPVTCNLTLPVACVARTGANSADKSGGPRFESQELLELADAAHSRMAVRSFSSCSLEKRETFTGKRVAVDTA